jgi:2,5-furandicarboxylate decarboxylase 1
VIIADSQCSKLDPSTRNGVGAKMGIDATVPLDAGDFRFKRICVPGEELVDLAQVVDSATGGNWRDRIAR